MDKKKLLENSKIMKEAETPKAYNQEINLDNLDLERPYTLEEFEYINSWLKN
jgi:hypothetical protein